MFLLSYYGLSSAKSWHPCQERVDRRRFRLNFAHEIEKILCYDWFPTKGAESEKRANTGEYAHTAFPKTVDLWIPESFACTTWLEEFSSVQR